MSTINNLQIKKENRIAFIILVIVLVLKMLGHYFVIHPYFDLQRDEYLASGIFFIAVFFYYCIYKLLSFH